MTVEDISNRILDDSILHSDISEETIDKFIDIGLPNPIFPDELENAIAHYGVLGMKWGVRKKRKTSSGKVTAKQKFNTKNSQKAKEAEYEHKQKMAKARHELKENLQKEELTSQEKIRKMELEAEAKAKERYDKQKAKDEAAAQKRALKSQEKIRKMELKAEKEKRNEETDQQKKDRLDRESRERMQKSDQKAKAKEQKRMLKSQEKTREKELQAQAKREKAARDDQLKKELKVKKEEIKAQEKREERLAKQLDKQNKEKAKAEKKSSVLTKHKPTATMSDKELSDAINRLRNEKAFKEASKKPDSLGKKALKAAVFGLAIPIGATIVKTQLTDLGQDYAQMKTDAFRKKHNITKRNLKEKTQEEQAAEAIKTLKKLGMIREG